VGSIAGAIGGKMAANRVRFAKFIQARVEYFRAVETGEDAIRHRIEFSQEEVRHLQETYETRYRERCAPIVASAETQVAAVRDSHIVLLEQFTQGFPGRLDLLTEQLRTEGQKVLAEMPASRFGFLIPKDVDLFRPLIREWFRQASAKVAAEKCVGEMRRMGARILD
jgi:hypothetical protein